MEKQLEILRDMVVRAANETTDADLLDLVYRLLANQ